MNRTDLEGKQVMATVSPGRTTPSGDGSARSVGELVTQAQQDAMLLVRQEIELAKAELRADARKAGTGAALFAVMAALLALASIVLSAAAALGLAAAGLDPAVAFFIVGGFYVLVAVMLGLIGFMRLRKIGGPKRAIREAQESKALLDHFKA